MTENFRRIMEGLDDALRAASCDHERVQVLSDEDGRRVELCNACKVRITTFSDARPS